MPDGHAPPNVNYGFEVIGQDTLGGIATGKYTDVWASEGYAYVGTFQEPTCDRSRVFISDIRDPANPSTVGMTKSPPDTRINDVKTHRVGDTNVLIFTLEPCGPIVGNSPPEGNAHAAVFVGRACSSVLTAPAGIEIALIERGDCAFTTKAQNVQAAGYITGIVFNQAGRGTGDGCKTSISMLVSADIPMLFLPRSNGFALLDIAGYDPTQCFDDPALGDGTNPPLPAFGTAGLDVNIGAEFDGWGYYHVLNNQMMDVTVPHRVLGDQTVGHLGEIG